MDEITGEIGRTVARLAVRARARNSTVAVLSGLTTLGIAVLIAGVSAMMQGRVVARIANTLERNDVQTLNLEVGRGQAVTVAKPELVDVDIVSRGGEDIYCYEDSFSYPPPPCVAWPGANATIRVTLSHRRGPDAGPYEIAIVDGNPYGGWSPTGALYDTVRHGKTSLVRAQLDRGAAVNAITDGVDGLRTPLHYALEALEYGSAEREQAIEVVRVLLTHGANPDVAPRYGEAPLVDAVRMGDVGLVRVLLQAGARPSVEDVDGNSALVLARETGNDEMVQVLLMYRVR